MTMQPPDSGSGAAASRPAYSRPDGDGAEEQTLGERLKAYRLRQDLTQKELAELAGLSAAAIYRIERNERMPSIRTLRKLESVLDCDLLDLFGLNPEP